MKCLDRHWDHDVFRYPIAELTSTHKAVLPSSVMDYPIPLGANSCK